MSISTVFCGRDASARPSYLSLAAAEPRFLTLEKTAMECPKFRKRGRSKIFMPRGQTGGFFSFLAPYRFAVVIFGIIEGHLKEYRKGL